jgi:endonuclease YncB( thermonuclease family)
MMRRRSSLAVIICITTLPFFGLAYADSFTGKVVDVPDGDTLSMKREGRAVTVHLAGIDCPEKKQPFGKRARQFTSDVALGKEVSVQLEAIDKYGSTAGWVTLPDGTNLNHELLRVGLAWWYRRYYPDDETLQDLEGGARVAKYGLWKKKNPMPPWHWRAGRRGQKTKNRQDRTSYHGDLRSGVFHHPSCPHYDCPDCKAVLKGREKAVRDGFRPCEVCLP